MKTIHAVLIGTLLLCVARLASADQQALIIEDINLIDVRGKQTIEHVSVLIEGPRITQIRRGLIHGPLREKARIIPAQGKYLIPGLMDIHVHLVGSLEVNPEGLRAVNIDRKKGIRALHSYLYSGVTSIFDSGNVPEYIFTLRNQERTGDIVSPRIFAAGGIVTYPGSHGSGAGATLVDDWPEAIPLLNEHIEDRPDMLKLTLEERGWGARPMIPIMPVDLMQKIIEYYNDRGIRATAHAASELRAREAIFAGVDALSHPVITGPISASFPRLMAAKQIPMATTLTIGENYSRLVEHPEFLDTPLYRAAFTEDEINKLKTETAAQYKQNTWTWWMKLMTPIAQDNLRQLNAAGAVLALGTDRSHGADVHREMELLVAAGIPVLDVLRIATLHAAKFLGREQDLGSVTEGKLADLVLLDANPLVDINNAKKINTVIKNGVVINRQKLDLPINK